jgi:hypothetical protein
MRAKAPDSCPESRDPKARDRRAPSGEAVTEARSLRGAFEAILSLPK